MIWILFAIWLGVFEVSRNQRLLALSESGFTGFWDFQDKGRRISSSFPRNRESKLDISQVFTRLVFENGRLFNLCHICQNQDSQEFLYLQDGMLIS